MGGDLVAGLNWELLQKKEDCLNSYTVTSIWLKLSSMQSSQVQFLQLLHLSNEGATAKRISEGFCFYKNSQNNTWMSCGFARSLSSINFVVFECRIVTHLLESLNGPFLSSKISESS